MSTETTERPAIARGSQFALSRGLVTVLVAVAVLFAASAVLAPTSVSRGALLGMLPFAAILAIAALGQTLVVQQGGIDLSVPGAMSLTIVLTTHFPDGQDLRFLPAAALALACLLVAGLLNGLLIGVLALNPIVATLGTNALLYAGVLFVSGGTPRYTTDVHASLLGSVTIGIPHAVIVAILALAVVVLVVKFTASGRRFEAVGANSRASWAMGLHVRGQRASAYVGAQVLYWLAGVTFAGVVTQPTAFQGDAYLLPSVAAVVLGGTSLLGGRGFPVATVVAALFLSQLEQFVLALGVPFAVRTLVEAAALTIGVALYTVDWAALRHRLALRRPLPVAGAP